MNESTVEKETVKRTAFVTVILLGPGHHCGIEIGGCECMGWGRR